MKEFYPYLKTVLASSSLFLCLFGKAQNPTTVVSNNTCAVVDDFNSSDGGFTTPSIYAEGFQYQFNYKMERLAAQFQSSPAATTAPYFVSLISPVYQNTAPDGQASVGFLYNAPPNTSYRVRIIRPTVSSGLDIIAVSSLGDPSTWTTLPMTEGTICIQMNDQDIHVGESYRYEFTFYVRSTASPVVFDNFALSSLANAPVLPVVFNGLFANRSGKGVELKWDVASETNVKEYRVERSLDGSTFASAGVVSAKQTKLYQFFDGGVLAANLYYRVVSVDVDGKTKTSSIVRLTGDDSYSSTARVYPSPARNEVTILHDKVSGGALITILSMDGKPLKQVKPSVLSSTTPVDISSLGAGIYLVRINDGKGKIQTCRLVKQ